MIHTLCRPARRSTRQARQRPEPSSVGTDAAADPDNDPGHRRRTARCGTTVCSAEGSTRMASCQNRFRLNLRKRPSSYFVNTPGAVSPPNIVYIATPAMREAADGRFGAVMRSSRRPSRRLDWRVVDRSLRPVGNSRGETALPRIRLDCCLLLHFGSREAENVALLDLENLRRCRRGDCRRGDDVQGSGARNVQITFTTYAHAGPNRVAASDRMATLMAPKWKLAALSPKKTGLPEAA